MKSEIRVLAEEVRLPGTNLPVIRYSIQEVNIEDNLVVIAREPLGSIASHMDKDCISERDEYYALKDMKVELHNLKGKIDLLTEALSKDPVYFKNGELVDQEELYSVIDPNWREKL